ncbi:MAG TPA: hypothetical protein VF406_05420 [Thermodesulfobacteriota bacterium]
MTHRRLHTRAGLGAALAVLVVTSAGCASRPETYPGHESDLQPGARPMIVIGETGSARTDPAELTVRSGTDVAWFNASDAEVFVRFEGPIARACGTPVNFKRSSDGTSYVSGFIPPDSEARLCFSTPGRYAFVVSSTGTEGTNGAAGEDTKYGAVVVE